MIVLILILLLVTISIIYCNRHLFISSIPTTWQLPIIGHLIRLHPLRPFETVANWGWNKLGSIFQLNFGGQYIIILNDYTAIREAYIRQSDIFNDRPDMWLFTELQNGKRGISMSDGVCWREQRNFVMRTLSNEAKFGGNRRIEQMIDDEIVQLFSRIDDESLQQKSIDVDIKIRLCIGNVINRMLYGFRFEHNDQRFIDFQLKLRQVLDLIGMSGLLMTFRILRYIPYFGYNRLQSIWKEMFTFHEQEIEMCRQMYQQDTWTEDNFVLAYLEEIDKQQQMDSSEENYFNMNQLKYIVMDMWSGGQDTAATTVLWCILYIVTNDIQDRIYDEMCKYCHSNRPSYHRDRHQLPYVQAVIMESQRLASIVPFALGRRATRDTNLLGFSISKGTTVMPNLWACHMDVNYFINPHKFCPDRFLNTDGSLRSHVDGFVPFSIGKRQCVGDQFSKVCMFQLITSIIWQYRLRFDEHEPMPSLQPRFGLILDPEKYRIIFEKRQHITDNASC